MPEIVFGIIVLAVVGIIVCSLFGVPLPDVPDTEKRKSSFDDHHHHHDWSDHDHTHH